MTARKYRGTEVTSKTDREQRDRKTRSVGCFVDSGERTSGLTSKQIRHDHLQTKSRRVNRRRHIRRHVQRDQHQQQLASSAPPDHTPDQPSHPILHLPLLPRRDRSRRKLYRRSQRLQQHQRGQQAKVRAQEERQRLCVRREVGGEVGGERGPGRCEADERSAEAEDATDGDGWSEDVLGRGDGGGKVRGGDAEDGEEDDDRDREEGDRVDVKRPESEERGLQTVTDYKKVRSRVKRDRRDERQVAIDSRRCR